MPKRFDPVAALADSPPTYKRPSVFDHPRVQAWLGVWVNQDPRPSLAWMCAQIRRGAKLEKLKIAPVTPSNLYRYLHERDGQSLMGPRGEVRPGRRPRQ